MTPPDDDVVVLAAVRAVRKAEAIRSAVQAGHPSTQFACVDVPPSTQADPGVPADSRVKDDDDGGAA